jgi:hypothetical protein
MYRVWLVVAFGACACALVGASVAWLKSITMRGLKNK